MLDNPSAGTLIPTLGEEGKKGEEGKEGEEGKKSRKEIIEIRGRLEYIYLNVT